MLGPMYDPAQTWPLNFPGEAMWDEWAIRLTPQKVLWRMGGGSFLARMIQKTQQGKVDKAKNSFFGKLEGAGWHKEEIKNIYSSLTWQKPLSCFLMQELKAMKV